MEKYTCPPKIYKYTPLLGLKATLEHKTFKLSRPSDFNDPIDMYLQETIGQGTEEFLESLKREFHGYLVSGIKARPSRNSAYGGILNLMHQAIDKAPDDQKENLKKELFNTPIEEMYDLDRIKRTASCIINAVNTAFSLDGVFCSTRDNNSLLMWAHYADHHRGAIIEYAPSIEKDSVFLASRRVKYSTSRPMPYKDAAAMVSGLEQSSEETVRDIVDRLVYTKSKDWEYEQEYRLYIPSMISPNQKFTTLKFHPEELTAIYLGCRMGDRDISQINEMAKTINPLVKLYKSIIAPREYRVIYQEI